MRVYPELTQDGEYLQLGVDGYSGSLNDRQFAFLRGRGLIGSLPDMFGQRVNMALRDRNGDLINDRLPSKIYTRV